MTQTYDQLAVAVHEAAHCLAAHVFRIPLAYVTIVKSGDSVGHVQHCCDPNTEIDPAQWIMFSLAGEAAERNLLSIKCVKGVGPDFRRASASYKVMCDEARVTKRRVPTDKELKVRTDALVRKYRGPIIDLAAILMACGTLDGLTAHHILQNAIDPQPPQPIRKRAARVPLAERLAQTAARGLWP